ncbi:MAG: DNA polymerase Y family protein [Alcaligenaceae bacterium]|nr:DNA polymerase Y family protein [Alcaligenaceae bacterium]
MLLWICLKWPEASRTESPGLILQRLALAMLRYSPRVARFRSDSIVVEVSASLSLFGGVRSLWRRVRRAAQYLAPSIQIGMAPSASGAWLLAGSPQAIHKRVVRPCRLARRLAPLPAHSLPEAWPHRQWLENIGCQNLGDLRKLPRQGLRQRSSPALLHALDTAYAQEPETFSWFVPPARFRQSLEPDFHLRQAAALLAATQPLLLALCGWLQHRQEALHDFQLILHHEKGRLACAPTTLALRFSAATWRMEDFNRVLKERLQHCILPRPAIRLELIAGPSQPRAPASDTLFPDPSQYVQEEQRLLDLLAARLGRNGIQRPRPLAHHLPEQANTWAADPAPPASQSLPSTVGERPRPFWLLSQPRPLVVRQHRPIHQGRPLRLVQGPERIETGWYSGPHQRRDYFVAEDPEGARYWLYRERETGESWFLHGLFA